MTKVLASTPRRTEATGGRSRRAAGDEALFRRYVATREPRLRDALCERYLPLARSIALRYARGNEPLDDLVQVASVGLIKAVDRYDPARGTAFTSFAVPTIAGELRRHFRDRCWAVRPPRDLQEKAMEVDKVRDELSTRLGKSPTVRQIGQALELPDEAVLEALQARRAASAVSFTVPRGSDGEDGDTLGDVLGGDDDNFELAEHRATLGRMLSDLTDREREVLRLRFEEDMTQDQIAQLVGVSQMQISRIIRGSIAKLQLQLQME